MLRAAEHAVEIVRKMFVDHEGMHADFPPRVYLDEFNRASLNVRMICSVLCFVLLMV